MRTYACDSMQNKIQYIQIKIMPFFQYECDHCKATVDLIRPYADRNREEPCRECNEGQLKFVDKIHPTAFKLKGNGWYETDFKTKT